MKNRILTVAITFLMAVSAFSQIREMDMMNAEHKQGSMMDSHQMMGQDMMHDMSGIMQQMSGMMEKNGGQIDHAQMMEMATMMGDMSHTMKEMAGQMSHGKMSAAQTKKMHERMEAMRKKMEMMTANEHK